MVCGAFVGIIDAAYQTFEQAVIDQSNKEGGDGEVLRGTVQGITCVPLNNTTVCVSSCSRSKLWGRAAGVMLVGPGKVG